MANLRISVWVPRALGLSFLGIILYALSPELGRVIALGGMFVAGIGLLFTREDQSARADKSKPEAVSWF
jgi:hypothetical protein